MKPADLPIRHQDTLLRKTLRRAELVRYWWEYRGRLAALLRQVDGGGSVQLDARERASIRRFWKDYGVSYVNLQWYRLFKALHGSVDPRFVPEEIFRTRLEPLLCRRDVSAAYHDKNQMDRIFADVPRPRTVVRNIYGAYFDEAYQPIRRDAVAAHLAGHHGPHFLKPAISGTGSGNNVARVEFVNQAFRLGASTLSLAEIERIYVQDFVIQEAVSQHASLALFHPGSLNTLRVITLRLNETLRLIAATLRVGNGSHVDNGHAGGLLCGVNIDSGALTGFACDVQFRKHDRHPLTGAAFAGNFVSFAKTKELALAVHGRLPYFDVLSCDIAILDNGAPCLVEVNTFGQGVEPHQYLKGAPLFDTATEDLLSLVASRARSGWSH
ncbi:MAG: sugar-transfer associated ATP-grasp domain-containing protein [Vicinamibacterales bacterium]